MNCDHCDKPAIFNYQKVWSRYPIDAEGNYGDSDNCDDTHLNDDPNGDDNVFVCEKHNEEWLEGTL